MAKIDGVTARHRSSSFLSSLSNVDVDPGPQTCPKGLGGWTVGCTDDPGSVDCQYLISLIVPKMDLKRLSFTTYYSMRMKIIKVNQFY